MLISCHFKDHLKHSCEPIRRYDTAAGNITDYFVDNAQNRGTSLGLAEYVGFSIFVGIFLVQGFFIFRPLVKLASDNYLSANKAFIKVKKSEQQLKINFQKQKLINKKLYLSRKRTRREKSQAGRV